jgi:hypothetical protein
LDIISSPPEFNVYPTITKGVNNQIKARLFAEQTPNEFTFLLFCEWGNNCLIPRNDPIQTGKIRINFEKGSASDMAQPVNYLRSLRVVTSLPVFYSNTPKYYAIGISSISFVKSFSISVNEITNNYIQVAFNALPDGAIKSATINYFISTWGMTLENF